MVKNMTEYKSVRLIDGKPRKVIVDENGNIVNRNPNKDELKGLEKEFYENRQPNRYTNEELLEYLRQFYEMEGKVPIEVDFTNSSKFPSYGTYIIRFGSWEKCLQTAGLVDPHIEGSLEETTMNNEYTNYKSRRITGWITIDKDGKILNRNPTEDELKCFKKEPYKKRHPKRYTDEELLGHLRRSYEKIGNVPTVADFTNNCRLPSYRTYVARFGSWNKGLEIAGIINPCIDKPFKDIVPLEIATKSSSYNHMSKEFQDECNRLGLTGCQLTEKYRKEGKSPEKGVYKQNKVHTKIYTEKQLLDHLRQFYEESLIPPAEKDFTNNPEYPSVSTYVKYFGSWSNALKSVEMDVGSIVQKGILLTNEQKARLTEMIVRDHFERHPVDLAGENKLSPCDGICPNGRFYDVKSSSLNGYFWQFGTKNKYKEEIEIYYFLAFNEDWTKLEHGWRIPGEIAEGTTFYVGTSGGRFNMENMKEYDITDKFVDVLKKYKFLTMNNIWN